MAIKQVKSHPVNGPYESEVYTSSAKQGKNNTFTWTTKSKKVARNFGGYNTNLPLGYTHPDGNTYSTYGEDGHVYIWESQKGQSTKNLELGKGWV